jgi:hypothetical protein
MIDKVEAMRDIDRPLTANTLQLRKPSIGYIVRIVLSKSNLGQVTSCSLCSGPWLLNLPKRLANGFNVQGTVRDTRMKRLCFYFEIRDQSLLKKSISGLTETTGKVPRIVSPP